MTINIEINQNNCIASHIHFSYNDVKVDYGTLDGRLLSLLVEAYHRYIDAKISNSQVSILSLPRLVDIKAIGKVLTNIRKIRKVIERYQNLRAIDMFTVDVFQNKILARTTVELDADILTIVHPDLLNVNQKDIFTNIHRANVRLTNYLFLYPLKRIFTVIKSLVNIARLVSMSLWIIFSAIIFFSLKRFRLIIIFYL